MNKIYLSPVAARRYLECTRLSYVLAIIDNGILVERIATLRHLCEIDSSMYKWCSNWLEDEDFEYEILWEDDLDDKDSEVAGNQTDSGDSSAQSAEDDSILHLYIPKPKTGLSEWHFHPYDPDFFPSVPHGHWQGKSKPKLDSYLGWVYNGSKQIRREKRKFIIALWNDQSFRDFALSAIIFYDNTFPHYKGWRVKNQFKLPRKR